MMKLSQGSVWGGSQSQTHKLLQMGLTCHRATSCLQKIPEEMAKEDQEASKGKEGIRGEGGAVLPLPGPRALARGSTGSIPQPVWATDHRGSRQSPDYGF